MRTASSLQHASLTRNLSKMNEKIVDINKVQSVLDIVNELLKTVDNKSAKYNILLFLKSYSYYLMKKDQESLFICNLLLEHSYRVKFNRSIVCQTYNLKTMIYMRNSEFTNMYNSIQESFALDRENEETHQLFNLFKEKLVC